MRGWLAHHLPLLSVVAGVVSLFLGTLWWWTLPAVIVATAVEVTVACLGHPRWCNRCGVVAARYRPDVWWHRGASAVHRTMRGRWGWWLLAAWTVPGAAGVVGTVAADNPWPLVVVVTLLWWVCAGAQYITVQRLVVARLPDPRGDAQ